MPRAWGEIEQAREFQDLSREDRAAARDQYWRDVVRPQTSREDISAAKRAFFDRSSAAVARQQLPDEVQYSPAAGGGRGGQGGPTAEELAKANPPNLVQRVRRGLTDAFTSKPSAAELIQQPRPADEPVPAADLARQSLSPDAASARDAREVATARRANDRVAAAPERTVLQQVLDTTNRKPLDQSLGGLALETGGDAARGAVRGVESIAQSGWAAARAGAEAVGADDAARLAAAAADAGTRSMDSISSPDRDSTTQKVFESTFANVPILLGLGTGTKALTAMGAMSGAQAYHEARNRGFAPSEAAERGTVFGLAEMLGEKVGLPALGRLFSQAAGKVGTKQLGNALADLLVKEQVGEQATTAMQDAYEKVGRAGLRPDMTLGDYLNDAIETSKVTLGQSLLMGGGAAAINRVARRFEDPSSLKQALLPVAEEHGVSPKAFAAVADRAQQLPPEERDGFVARALDALERRGLVKKPGASMRWQAPAAEEAPAPLPEIVNEPTAPTAADMGWNLEETASAPDQQPGAVPAAESVGALPAGGDQQLGSEPVVGPDAAVVGSVDPAAGAPAISTAADGPAGDGSGAVAELTPPVSPTDPTGAVAEPGAGAPPLQIEQQPPGATEIDVPGDASAQQPAAEADSATPAPAGRADFESEDAVRQHLSAQRRSAGIRIAAAPVKTESGWSFVTRGEPGYEEARAAATARAEQRKAIDAAAHDAATSPKNDRPEPSQAQKEAGNYKAGHFSWNGLGLTIENPKGSKRRGVGPGGKPWSVKLPAHYGYVKRTEGADGDHLDIYMGPNPDSARVFVVDQVDHNTGKFDEHKVVLGADSAEQAQELYDAGFSDGKGPQRRAAVTEMSVDQFKAWARDGVKSEPLGINSASAAPQESAAQPNEGGAAPEAQTESISRPSAERASQAPATPPNVSPTQSAAAEPIVEHKRAGKVVRGYVRDITKEQALEIDPLTFRRKGDQGWFVREEKANAWAKREAALSELGTPGYWQKRLDETRRQAAVKEAAAPGAPAAPRDASPSAAVPDARSTGVETDGLKDFSNEAKAQAVDAVTADIDKARSTWKNAPEAVVAFDMNDPKVPAAAREDFDRLRRSGAQGAPEGFFLDGKVYLLASQIRTPDDAARVLAHEALGHYGLRGVFGDQLSPMLDRLAKALPDKVGAKAKQYGLDMADAEQRRQAAEEYLAELAQSRPTSTWVQNLVAKVRTWLRDNIPGFANTEMTDAEVISQYIAPARGWVERGRGGSAGPTRFMFAGVNAATYDVNKLTSARRRLAMDDNAESVRKDTGWAVGVDGKPRFEISDAEAALKGVGPGQALGEARGVTTTRLGDILDHAALFEAYPRLADMPVRIEKKRRVNGSFDGKSIVLADHLGPTKALSTLLHEVQHAVQATEDFAGGADPNSITGLDTGAQQELDSINKRLNSGDYETAEYDRLLARKREIINTSDPTPAADLYRRTAGEVEARNTQARAKMTDSQRRETPPAATADVAAADVIVPRSVSRFSLAKRARDVASGKVPGAQLFRDIAVNTPVDGRLHWWHKTVGTMNNLAARSPAFAKVFDGVQRFIGDVSKYATEAADQAPTILPKLEHVRDIIPFAGIGRAPLSPVDNKMLGTTVFHGTLYWTRNSAGRPVKITDAEQAAESLDAEQKVRILLRDKKVTPEQVKRMQQNPLDMFDGLARNQFEAAYLRPGIVFTPEELKRHFGANDEQVKHYQQFRAAVDRSLTDLATSDMLRVGGADVAELADQVMVLHDAGLAGDALVEHLRGRQAAEPARAAALEDTVNTILDKADKVRDLMARGYAPLMRFGTHKVDVVDASGERLYFGLFESAREAARMARSLREQFPEAQITRGTLSQRENEMYAGVTPETLELFGEILGLDKTGDKQQDQMFQEYLRTVKNQRSAMKRLIHRKGIAGFSEDAGRVLASFVYSNARQTSGNLHVGGIGQAVQEIPREQGQLKDEAIRLQRYVMNPQEEAQAIRGLLFAQFLGGSIASAMVNLSQTPQITFPYLSQFGGPARAALELGKAVRDLWRRKTGDPQLDAALKSAAEAGIVAPQEVFQLMAQARGAATLRAGDGTLAGNVRAKTSNLLSRLGLAWGKPFSLAELANRRIAFIAAYRLAPAGSDRAAFAEKAVNDTQFVNNKGNKPRWARGAVGGTLFTFKSYSVNYLQLLNRMWNQGAAGSAERRAGRRAVAVSLLMLWAFAGTDGLPGEADVEDLVDGALQRLGLNFSSRQAKLSFLVETCGLGELGARFVTKGLSGLPGVPIDFSGRLGLGNLIPGTGLFPKKDDYTQDVTEIIGPVGSFAKALFTGAGELVSGLGEAVRTGEAGAALEGLGAAAAAVAPVAAQNLIKAADMAKTGNYRDSKGRKVVEVDAADVVAKAIGFQPNVVARTQAANRSIAELSALNRQMAAEIASKWAAGLVEKEPRKVRLAQQALEVWNRNNPESIIAPAQIQAAVRKQVQAAQMSKSERTVRQTPKGMRAAAAKELSGAEQ